MKDYQLDNPSKSELISEIDMIMDDIHRGVEYKKLESDPLLAFRCNSDDYTDYDDETAYEFDPNEVNYVDLGYAFDNNIQNDLMELRLTTAELQLHPEFEGIPNNVIALIKALEVVDIKDSNNPDKLAKALFEVDFKDGDIKSSKPKPRAKNKSSLNR